MILERDQFIFGSYGGKFLQSLRPEFIEIRFLVLLRNDLFRIETEIGACQFGPYTVPDKI